MRMYTENEPSMEMNDTVLNVLSGELYTIEVYYQIPDTCNYPYATIHGALHQKQKPEIQICLSQIVLQNWC